MMSCVVAPQCTKPAASGQAARNCATTPTTGTPTRAVLAASRAKSGSSVAAARSIAAAAAAGMIPSRPCTRA